MRTQEEHYYLQWGDVTLKMDATGAEYLQYNERQTKTRQGDNPRDVRIIAPKAFSTSGRRDDVKDPVSAYKVFAGKRPIDMVTEDSPFYLGINVVKPGSVHKGWYKCQQMGINKLGSLMKSMFANAGLDDLTMSSKNISNHSARKTMIQTLKDNNVPDTNIQQISGHKNIQSINNYNRMSMANQQHISHVLSSGKEIPATITRPDNTEMNQKTGNVLLSSQDHMWIYLSQTCLIDILAQSTFL